MEEFAQTKNEARKIKKVRGNVEIFKLSSWTNPRKTKKQKFWIGKKEDWELKQK